MKPLSAIFACLLMFASLFIPREKSFAKDAWYLKPPPENAAEKLAALPSERQIRHAENEMYAFFHFGINTFTGSEWGNGKENPTIFNPTALDTDQWIKTIADAGFTGAILTAKHHDGFCLWPSEYTDFSVKSSGSQTNVVKAFAESCKNYGVKFGFYLSPWDQNAPSYGKSEAYNDYYVSQLTELLTNYGEVFEVWFDGAIGKEYEGIQTYDWDRWVAVVRELQPNACTAIGPPIPDVAWVGNEQGRAKGNVFSVRKRHGQWVWAKNECDVSIRPGWFYHAKEKPKSIDQLMNIYYNSVGKNCTLLLNIPPNQEGLVDQKDVKRLAEMGRAIKAIYAFPIPSTVTSLDKDGEVYAYDFKLDSKQQVKHVVLSEDVNSFSERIERFTVYAKIGKIYFKGGTAESAGGKTIVRLKKIMPKTDSYRIVVAQSKANPVLRDVGFYG